MTLRRFASALPRPYAPLPSEFENTFWVGLSEGRFQVTRCEQCDWLQFPPRPVCPGCLSSAVVWQEIEGRGTLYARTRIHAAGGPFACMTPYSVGLIDLEEGVRILTRLMPSASSLTPGSAVEIAVLDHTDGPLFVAVSVEKDQTL